MMLDLEFDAPAHFRFIRKARPIFRFERLVESVLLIALVLGPSPVRAELEMTFRFTGVTSKAEAAFRREMLDARERVRDWWGATYEGPIVVEVVTSQVLSMALVPAWRGERGRMIFGAKRVNAGEAAGIHEMTHVYAPNANRFLAEGLAVYAHYVLGGHAAYPNFGKDLDEVATAAAGKAVMLALERTATPAPLETITRDGEALAGSFVRYLIGVYGIERFRDLFALTPLQERKRDAGSVERWTAIYGRSFPALVEDWLAAFPNRR